MSLAISPDTSAAAKMPRRRTTKGASVQTVEKVKKTIHLTGKAEKMLGIFAVMTGQSDSAIVEALIVEHCRRFVVQDRAKSADEAMQDVSAI